MRRVLFVVVLLISAASARAQGLSAGGVYPPRAAGSAAFDPSTTLDLYEEFKSGDDPSAGRIGENGLALTAVSAGTTGKVASAANHPGLQRLNSHATNDNSGVVLSFGANPITTTEWRNRDWSMEAVIIPGSNSTAITNTALYFGLANTVGGDPSAVTNCIWIRRDSDLTDSAFIFQLGNAAGAAGCNSAADAANTKVVASTITPVAGTAYRFRIRRASAGVGGTETFYFRVNDEAEKTFCASGCDDTLAAASTADLAQGVWYLTRTTTGVMSADLDYLTLHIPGLVRY